MSEIGDDFKALREHHRQVRHERAENFNADGWVQHSQWHYSRELNGSRLDYWPSRQKFRYRGKTMTGDVEGFINRRRDE